MTTTFVLKDRNAKTETLIFLVARVKDKRIKVSIQERILPDYWNVKTCRVKATAYFPGHIEFNALLRRTEQAAQDKYRRFQNDNGRLPTMEELKALLLPEERKPVEVKQDLFSFIDDFIIEAGKRKNLKTDENLSTRTIWGFKRSRQMLSDFQKYSKKKIDFSTIDLDFYHDYVQYLTYEQKMANNTVGKHIKVLKIFLNAASEKGYNTNRAFKSHRFKVIREESTAIYLNEAELAELYCLDLSKKQALERVRDLFIVGCWTGLRFSDFSRLEAKNIINGKINIKTQKTGKAVSIPLHKTVIEIMAKYEGKTANSLPPALCNQKMNAYLKEIGQLVTSLATTTEKVITKGGVKIITQGEKWRYLTTHTARRSFATNLYLDKVPAFTIMQITGHKTEKSFFTYIKVTPEESADVIANHWQQKESILKIA